jgi:hypothetical protein
MFLIDSLTTVPSWAWLALASVILAAWAARWRYHKGLSRYPGPFIASFTDFWRLWQWVWYTDMGYFPKVAHYGRIIRVGPATLLFNDPEAIKDIYMTHFNKVSRVRAFLLRSRSKESGGCPSTNMNKTQRRQNTLPEVIY